MVRALTAARLNKDDGFSKTITVTNAQMLTLNSVPVTIMTAPTQSIYAICILEVFARITAGTAYTSLHDMTIAYASSGATICTLPGTAFLDQTAATGVFAAFIGTSSKSTIVSPGAAIVLTCGTGDPATGTSPLTLKIKYKVHKVV